ncbi:MAG TPA: hypothetical protein DCP98_05290 [Sphaerochaeta sp.]|nr:hypothetical protein [Sphaerochaeta sp.]
MRQEFTMYKRNGIYYGSVYDEKTQKRQRFSTGCKNKTEAFNYCMAKVEEYKSRSSSFKVLSTKWWTPECPYLKETRRNGGDIGDSYIDTARRTLEIYMLPVFGRYRISDITPGMIEDWKYSLVEEHGLSNKSANTYLTVLRTMFDYWWRRGDIKENPCDKVIWMKVNSAPRGILSPEEAREVLMKPGLWNNPTAFLANLLAACTGMRAGEIQALRAMDFTETSIVVEHSWVERYQKLKCTKTGIVREIPIHPMLRGVLLSGKLPTDFIFTMEGRDRPIYRSCLLDNLRRALERAGISRQEQKERNICFHSWRHYLNTRMRVAGIPDVVTRQVTGHTTEEMTERYTHISADDAIGVLALQSALMPKRPADESDGARCEIIPPSETAC